mgnify:CR=1 FL=1
MEDNKKDAIAKVSDCVKGDARISVAELKTKYPQGAERSLIYATTGRAINSTCFRQMQDVLWTTWQQLLL